MSEIKDNALEIARGERDTAIKKAINLLVQRDEARAMVAAMAVVIQDLLDMANRHDCGECGGFLSSELDFVSTAEKAIARAEALHE